MDLLKPPPKIADQLEINRMNWQTSPLKSTPGIANIGILAKLFRKCHREICNGLTLTELYSLVKQLFYVHFDKLHDNN